MGDEGNKILKHQYTIKWGTMEEVQKLRGFLRKTGTKEEEIKKKGREQER